MSIIRYGATLEEAHQVVMQLDDQGLRDVLTQLQNDFEVRNRAHLWQVIATLLGVMTVSIVLIVLVDGLFEIDTWQYWVYHVTAAIILPMYGLWIAKKDISDPYYLWRHRFVHWVVALDMVTLDRFGDSNTPHPKK